MTDEARHLIELYEADPRYRFNEGEARELAALCVALIGERSARDEELQVLRRFLTRVREVAPDLFETEPIRNLRLADEEHGYAEHLREAREVEAHQEEKHGDA